MGIFVRQPPRQAPCDYLMISYDLWFLHSPYYRFGSPISLADLGVQTRGLVLEKII